MCMVDIEKLGNNIRYLRKAYGESQEKLGFSIGTAKSTISLYESAKREPDKNTLEKIAKHYSITIDELLLADFSKLESVSIDYDFFWKNIDVLLPLAFSENAIKNQHFKKAHKVHREIYKQLREMNMGIFEKVADCVDEYQKAYCDKKAKYESAINLVAIFQFIIYVFKTIPAVMETRPAALEKLMINNTKMKIEIECSDLNFRKDANEIMLGLRNEEIYEKLDEWLATAKESQKCHQLADYYLALRFVWGVVENDESYEYNKRIGTEMMKTFISVNNIYAAQFWLLSIQCLHIVNDKRHEE